MKDISYLDRLDSVVMVISLQLRRLGVHQEGSHVIKAEA